MEENNELAPPTGPFRPDTSGIDTSRFPKPPPRSNTTSPPPGQNLGASKPKPPSLPPRLPPRAANGVAGQDENAQPSASYLNQGAINRLGQAGISVPGFGIGAGSSPPQVPPRSSGAPPPVPGRASPSDSQMNALQSRFSKMSNPSSSGPATGTTWAEKQAAIKTATQLRNDPSSVSLKDVRTAATTAKNFHDRHGEQVAAGVQSANQLDQKYGLLDRAKGLQQQNQASGSLSGIGKAPPPAPPAKKRELLTRPPPVPLSSKPRG
jgi:hypothetical protein